jgi:predicted small secreted protein
VRTIGATTLETIMLKKLLLVLCAAVIAASLSGCNTMEGFGRDIKSAGEGLEHEARKNK